LVTPLLDWSRSPYVAAFFAWTGFFAERGQNAVDWLKSLANVKERGAVSIWELVVTDDMPNGDELRILASFADHSQRQKAQQDVFTILDHSEHFELESYLQSRGLAHALTKYNLDVLAGPPASADLDFMNVRFVNLFPDLQGAARQANLDQELAFVKEMGALVARRQKGKMQ
jgi:hypothetical protein